MLVLCLCYSLASFSLQKRNAPYLAINLHDSSGRWRNFQLFVIGLRKSGINCPNQVISTKAFLNSTSIKCFISSNWHGKSFICFLMSTFTSPAAFSAPACTIAMCIVAHESMDGAGGCVPPSPTHPARFLSWLLKPHQSSFVFISPGR